MAVQWKIRDLELVVALHEEGSLTLAAKRVGITEPALSKRLQVVERNVDATLFERDHDGAKVTEPGRSFVEHAVESVHAFHRAVHSARETKISRRHRLRIGVSSYLSPRLIEQLRATELRLYRDLAIEIVTDYSLELLKQVHHRRLDLALVTSPPPAPALTSVRVAAFPFRIVFRNGHPLASKKFASLADVAEYPWVFFSQNSHPHLHERILQRVEAERYKVSVVHQISQADQVVALLTDNQMLAWLTPAGAERVAHWGFVSIPLRDEQIHLETHLVALADNKSLLVSEFFRSFVKHNLCGQQSGVPGGSKALHPAACAGSKEKRKRKGLLKRGALFPACGWVSSLYLKT
jgi:DNA-binding transcriptional LysR family regulator